MLRMSLALGVLLLAGCAGTRQASQERLAEVAAKGATVMPFDLSKTRHVFESLPDGGLQTVTAKQPDDSQQVRLIQEHLSAEAARFSRGDFTDPMAIHGHEMPGVAELRAGAARVRIEYTPRNDGGQVRYTATDPALIAALHRWFEAQRMDHGSGSG